MNDDYRSGYSGQPALHQSTAHILLSRSPKHAWLEHPMLGGQARKRTSSMDVGSILHGMLLGDSPSVLRIPYDSFRTKAAQQARDEAEKLGMIPMLTCQNDALASAAEVITEKLTRLGIVLSGKSEVPLIWTSNGVACRGKADHVLVEQSVILDLKFCDSAHPAAIDKHVNSFGYDIQAAAYIEGSVACGLFDREPSFKFMFIEVDPPHFVTVARLSGEKLAVGRSKWERAKEIWRTCLASSHWPEYVDGEHVVEAKPWELL